MSNITCLSTIEGFNNITLIPPCGNLNDIHIAKTLST